MQTLSLANQAKTYVYEQIKALPEAVAEKWSVTWGFAKTPERTWVYLGEIQWQSSEWATNRSREETFSIKTAINVRRTRGTVQEAEQELMRIASLIETMLASNPGLGIDGVVTTSFVPKSMDSFPSDQYSEAQYEADIQVTARFRRT